jgi:hypothetical protein
VASGAVVAILLLLKDSRTSDVRELALLSLAGGALGAAGRGLIEVIERLNAGWEFADGTQVTRWRLLWDRRREERALQAAGRKEGDPTHGEEVETVAGTPEAGRPRSRPQDDEIDPRDDLFGVYILPFLFLLPLVGAVLGVALFAGVSGGFLLASGDQELTYSQPGFVFLSFLAGFFAETFLRRLARSADALFGVERRESPEREPPRTS